MIRHIVVIDSQRGIAKDGDQPVHLKIDGEYFTEKTCSWGANVLMGKTLFAMLGALKGRNNYVASRHFEPLANAKLVSDLPDFMDNFSEDLWVIGGAEIYEQTLRYADELYVTKVEQDYFCDTFYPDYAVGFEMIYESDLITEDTIKYRFSVYKRRHVSV